MKKFFVIFFIVLFIAHSKAQTYKNHKHIAGSDTLIAICNNTSSAVFIGFCIDGDEMDFLHQVETDASCQLKNFELKIYDRWGNLVSETKEKFKKWFGNRAPFAGVQTLVYVFSYVDKDNKTVKHLGHIKRPGM